MVETDDAPDTDAPLVEFDRAAARRFRPNPDFGKIAVLVDVADTDAITVLNTSFGEQRMRGPFYAVAEDDGSYGAAQAQFERTHRTTGPNCWVKMDPVDAYQVDERCTVETHIDDHREASVVAERGDWVLRQSGGEIMVVGPDAFAQRYVPDENSD